MNILSAIWSWILSFRKKKTIIDDLKATEQSKCQCGHFFKEHEFRYGSMCQKCGCPKFTEWPHKNIRCMWNDEDLPWEFIHFCYDCHTIISKHYQSANGDTGPGARCQDPKQ